MILGKNGFFVTPSDSLAVIASHMKYIPHFIKHPATGVARSMPTSTAVDKVAERLGLNLYEVPTGRSIKLSKVHKFYVLLFCSTFNEYRAMLTAKFIYFGFTNGPYLITVSRVSSISRMTGTSPKHTFSVSSPRLYHKNFT